MKGKKTELKNYLDREKYLILLEGKILKCFGRFI